MNAATPSHPLGCARTSARRWSQNATSACSSASCGAMYVRMPEAERGAATGSRLSSATYSPSRA
jgi:hypothetical protein